MVVKREDYFLSQEAEDAFDYLVRLSPDIENAGFELYEVRHGYLRWALHFRNTREGGRDPFGIIVNKKSLRFYFRRPHLMTPPLNEDSVNRCFPNGKARRQISGEISVSLFSPLDVQRAMQLAFPQLCEHLNPEEAADGFEKLFVEGAVRKVVVNAYERSREAREACIAKWGCICVVCGFNFENTYGERGKGFIHVHHLTSLSSIGQAYQLDPEKDLRPICPNCHAMIHRFDPPISIDELQNAMAVVNPSLRN